MTIGERIKDLRESKNMPQTELAERIGAKKQTIYKYENNIITNIPSDQIELIARVLEVSPAYLMGWDEENAPGSTESVDELLKSKETEKKWHDILNQLSQENRDRLQEQAELLLLKQQVQADKEEK